MTPHIHADVIKAWADGAEIEWKHSYENEFSWRPSPKPSWFPEVQYRVRPEPRRDFFKYVDVHPNADTYLVYDAPSRSTNLRLTFDGETRLLKAAEVVG